MSNLAGCLVTGFEPFGGHLRNPSGEAAQLLADSGAITAVLPVDFYPARRALLALLRQHQPHTCLCTGVCLDETYRMETQARKVAEFADLEGPELLQGSWDFESLPLRLSDEAGAYVCESTYWSLLDFRAREGYPSRTAFLHVPPINVADSATTAEVIRELLDS